MSKAEKCIVKDKKMPNVVALAQISSTQSQRGLKLPALG